MINLKKKNKNTEKRNWKGLGLLPCLFTLLMMLGACSSVDCPLNSRVLCNYSFIKPDGTADTLKDTFTVKPLDWIDDTIYFNRGIDVAKFSTPISNSKPEDVLLILFKDTSSNITGDTIWVEKLNHPHLESADCTPKFFHTLTNVRSTRNRIEKIEISKQLVDYDTKENIKIYLSAGY